MASPPKDESQSKLLRVICTDPDATESSDDGSEPDNHGHIMSKRFVREIPLSAACSVIRDYRRSPYPKRAAIRRKVRKKETKTKGLDAIISTANIKKKHQLHHHHHHSYENDVGKLEDGDCCLQDSQFAMFLSEFLGGPKEYGKGLFVEDVTEVLEWEMDGGETMVASDIRDLELDSEAIKWINSLQR